MLLLDIPLAASAQGTKPPQVGSIERARRHSTLTQRLLASCQFHDSGRTQESASRKQAVLSSRSAVDTTHRHFSRLVKALLIFKKRDRHASFNFFDCEVDSFATRPKKSIPYYALPTLVRLGLSTVSRRPQFLPRPTRRRLRARDLDADLSRKLPFEEETPLNTLPPPSDEEDDFIPDDSSAPLEPIHEVRTRPSNFHHPPRGHWRQPTDDEIAAEAPAVLAILTAFLAKNKNVFMLKCFTETQLEW